MKGLGQGPYARILIFLIPRSLLVSRYSLTKTIPHRFASSPELWRTRGKTASRTCGLDGEARRGEAWDGSLMRRRDDCQWGGREEEGIAEARNGTAAHTTPGEIKRGTRRPNQLLRPWPVCTVCSVEETARKRGQMS